MKFEVFASVPYKPDIVSRLIMWKLDINYSHIGIIVDDTWVYQATGKGVNRLPLDEFLQTRHLIHRKEVSEFITTDHHYMRGWLDGNLGKGYGHAQYLGFLIPALSSLVANGNSREICSEFAGEFLVVGGMLSAHTFVSLDFVDPKTFIEAIKSY